MRTHQVINTHETSPFTLAKAMEVKKHFQYLVGNNYTPGNAGNIQAVVICPHDARQQLINEYHKKRPGNPEAVFRKAGGPDEAYDVMILARVSHPHLTAQLDVFKDIRTYAAERRISYCF